MPPPVLDPSLADTLAVVARITASATASWWVIGSAAMALHGLAVSVADVDLLLTADDAARVLRENACSPLTDGGTERLRSDVFGRITANALPIDVLGGFHVNQQDRWALVQPTTRLAVSLAGGTVHVPSRADLTQLTRSLGRPLDLRRADMLDALPNP